jgi:NADH:ubiquinone oxidoreductase subunit F (NADH-binding)
VTDLLTMPHNLLSARTRTYSEHLSILGALPSASPAELIALVTDCGLSGRGGAGFPSGRKLAAVARTGNAIVVANGAEGEPASSKDRVLLSEAPHLVLDGLEVAAHATGARVGYIYAPVGVLEEVIRPALRDRPRKLKVALVPSADTFVAGQESAVVAAIEGRPAWPVTRSDPVFVRGVRGRPTLVQNVETLGQLALIARFGVGWFRSWGTPEEPGSRLVTVSGAVRRPAVYEIPGGSRLSEVLDWAGGTTEPLEAVLVGGYHGAWVPWRDSTRALTLTRAALEPYGATPGAGVLIALPARRCGLQATAEITSYLAGESSGQCGPCLNGLPTLARHLDALAFGTATPREVHELCRVAGIVDGRGACQHPAGTVRLVRSALQAFSADVDLHLSGRCGAESFRRSTT